jgi:carboxyl-terminal processing protease
MILKAVALASLASTPALANLDFQFTEKQMQTAQEVVDRLQRHHYQEVYFNDDLSSKMYEQYLDKLDPAKSYLTQKDIKSFERYRHVLDDQLRKGKLEAGFTIFKRYQQRLLSRLESNIANLPEMLKSFDYSKDESLLVDPDKFEWPSDVKAADELWRKRIKASALSLKLTKKEPAEIEKVLLRRFENQLTQLKQTKSQDVFQLFLNSLAELYDPHTSYLSPRNSENFNINMSLSLEGIGAVLQREDEYVKVVRLVTAGPADKQGDLKASDRITAVAQGDEEWVDVVGWRLDEVVALIRGKKGTTVRLQVLPAKSVGEDETKTIAIVRNKVKLEEQSAQKKVIEMVRDDQLYKVGVIDIPTFYLDFEAYRNRDFNYKSTTRDVKRLIAELREENVEGIVIDLRDNGGGSLREANALSRLFIDSGPTVQIRHANARVDREPKSRARYPFYEGPIVVLINRLSASASEIFAAAVQDYGRGLIVGARSFGKGTVQSFSPVTEGHLKLTESKFYRVSGDSTQHRGVIPDIAFPAMYDADEVGESALDNALQWDTIHAVQHRRYQVWDSLIPTLKAQHDKRVDTDPDFIYLADQIALAREAAERESISLNEATRIKQREEDKAKQLAIENKRRKAKGLEPLASLNEEDEDENATEDVAANEADTGNSDDEVPDPYLQEASALLLDSVNLMRQVAARKNAAAGKQLP